MNKIFTFLLISVFVFLLQSAAQPFVGMQANSAGGGVHAGYQAQLTPKNISISGNSLIFATGLNVLLINSENPNIYYLTGGYVYSFSDEDAINISVSAGPAVHRYKDFSHYGYSGDTRILSVQKLTSYYNFELGKDWYMGRLFLNATYSRRFFFGIGLKAFLQ